MFAALFLLSAVALVGAQHPSPCPGVFKYNGEPNVPGQWTGEITLDSEYPLSGVWIRVLMDRQVEKLESSFGSVLLREPKDHLIKSRDYNLVPGSPLRFPITVHYAAGEAAPSLVGVRLNGRVVCPEVANNAIAALGASKCPGVFAYNRDQQEGDRWHGTVTLSSEYELQGVWIRVVLDQPAELLGNEFGEVRTDDNISYLIHNRNHTLVPGRPLRLAFWVKYTPGGPVPTIQTVRLNGRTVCGQIISEDNNQNIIYFPLLNRLALRVPTPQRQPESVTTTIPPPQRHNYPKQNIFPPFNPSSPSTNPTTFATTTFSSSPSPPLIQSSFNSPSFVTMTSAAVNVNTRNGTTTTVDTSGNQFISCGIVELEKIELITFGERARIAQWPWHGGIYLVKANMLDYICGMSLITEKHALTAAHCVVESLSTKKVRDPKTMVLYFGLLNRTEFSAPSVQSPTVNSIFVHDDYKVSENDIAVIKFDNKIKFTEFVRPVCLWEGDKDQRFIVNQTGTVVGFGVTQSGAISQELMFANILVVDTPTCIFSHRDFYSKYTSLNTFCAGNLTQSAVCNGDSGGAMVFRRDGSDVWQVRGIVSTAVRNVDTGLCDYNYYAIFTDAAKFTSWIEMALVR